LAILKQGLPYMFKKCKYAFILASIFMVGCDYNVLNESYITASYNSLIDYNNISHS